MGGSRADKRWADGIWRKAPGAEKKPGPDQEALAEQLYVSRTAISKWESGRGYPSIDSLKAIAGYFSVSLDELLSSDAILTIAEADQKRLERRSRALVFGLLDCSAGLLLFLPFFGERTGAAVRAVLLLSLAPAEACIKPILLAAVILLMLCGIAALALQNVGPVIWQRGKDRLSLGLSTASVLLFIACTQPYAAVFTFVLLIIKALLLIKWA